MYVIWTENKNAIDVMEKAGELFSGDNVVRGQGHYKGKGEESLRIEIFNDGKPLFNLRVYDFARWIARHNDQESVAVLRQADPNLVTQDDLLMQTDPHLIGSDDLSEPEGVYEKGK